MDSGAELTLQIARLVQLHGRQLSRSPLTWSFWPHGEQVGWDEARDLLAAAPKPLLVAPLIEPGALGLWEVAGFDAARRETVRRELANQVAYYAGKFASFAVGGDGHVRLDGHGRSCTMGVASFLRWAGEYAISVGVSAAPTAEANVARIIVRPPGGGAPPIGV